MASLDGCAGDAGWLVMITQIANGHCGWETSRHGKLPVFLYSKLSTRVVWNDGTGEQIIQIYFGSVPSY